jgi:hypothetical protein
MGKHGDENMVGPIPPMNAANPGQAFSGPVPNCNWFLHRQFRFHLLSPKSIPIQTEMDSTKGRSRN